MGTNMVDGGVAAKAPEKKEPAKGGLARTLGLVKAGWLKFAWFLARMNSAILLTVIYFLIIAPTNLVVRILRADLLAKRIGDDPSFWQVPEHPCDDLAACKRQF